MNQLEEMQTFVRVVEAGSITKAAEQMNTVKSAVSRRLAELESRLSVSLLTRTTRSLTLTEAGQTFYDHCVRIIDDVTEAESLISDTQQALKGRIKIALPLSYGLTTIAPLLQHFNELHPDIQFDIDFNDRKVELTEEGFDLAIRIAKLKDSTLIAKRINRIQLILCASPSYLERQGTPLSPAQLHHGHIKLHYHGSPEYWPFTTPSGGIENIKLPSAITANNGDFLCQAAIAGNGIIYSPDFICETAIKTGKLTILLAGQLAESYLNVYAVYPHNRHQSQRVKQLINFLSDQFKVQDLSVVNDEE
jgi:DNA-binding transcriptional LysR family regulator